MDRCVGYGSDLVEDTTARGLPCMPANVVYGHAAARGLDINRWSFGLDTGCVSRVHPLQTCWRSLIPHQLGLWSEIDRVGIGPPSSPHFFNPTRGRRRGRDRTTHPKRRDPGGVLPVTTAQAQVWGRCTSHRRFPRRRRLFKLTPCFIPFQNLTCILSSFCFRISFNHTNKLQHAQGPPPNRFFNLLPTVRALVTL